MCITMCFRLYLNSSMLLTRVTLGLFPLADCLDLALRLLYKSHNYLALENSSTSVDAAANEDLRDHRFNFGWFRFTPRSNLEVAVVASMASLCANTDSGMCAEMMSVDQLGSSSTGEG